MSETIKKDGWVNIYKLYRTGTLIVSKTFSTKKLADEAPIPMGGEKVGCTQIEWEERNGCGCK